MSKYKIVSILDTARMSKGVVSIDRSTGLFHVRPHMRRRAYTLPLADVASIVVSMVIKAEVASERRSRA